MWWLLLNKFTHTFDFMIWNIEEKLEGVITCIPASYAALILARKENDCHS
jgi:hypothetical protein